MLLTCQGRTRQQPCARPAPSPPAHLHGIYTGSFHASMHTASRPPARQASPGASMETKEYVLSLMSPAVGPEGHRENPHRKEGTPWGPERGQGPHWRLPSNQGQDLSPTFSTSGSQNPLLLPFPPPSRGLWREPLLPLLPSCDLEKLTDQVIDSELLPKTKLVLEPSTVCKKGPLRSPAKPLPLPHEDNEAQEGPGLPRIAKGDGGPRSLPPAQSSLGSPKLSDSWPEHLLPPWPPWEGSVWERKEPRRTFSVGLAQESTGQPDGRERFQPCGVCKPARSSAQIQRGELSQVSHIPLPSRYCSGKSPSKSQKAWIPAQGAGERGTRGGGRGEKKAWVSLCISPQDAPPSIPGPVLVLSTIPPEKPQTPLPTSHTYIRAPFHTPFGILNLFDLLYLGGSSRVSKAQIPPQPCHCPAG